MPVSTADTMRRTRISPLSSDFDLGDRRDEARERNLAAMPRPVRGGSGVPQPAFSAARFTRRQQPRRIAEQLAAELERDRAAAFAASSSTKLSTANTLLFGPTPRQKPVSAPASSCRTYSTRRFGMSYGMSTAPSTRVEVDAFAKRRRQPAREDRGARDAMRPRDDAAVGQARREAVVVHRPEDIVLDVLLARPDDFDGAVDLFGDAHGLLDLDRSRAGGRTRRRADGCAPSPSPAEAP